MIFESLKLQRLLLDMDKGILKISDLELGRTYTMPLKSYTHEVAILWFHLLGEFDEGKRNCRKRLDGHNRRRRKPQLEPMSCSGSFLSNYQGAQLLPFSSSCVYPSTTVVNPTWAGVVKTESDPGLHNQHLQHQNMFLGSSTSSRYNKGSGNKQKFTLFQSSCSNQRAAHAASVCQPLLNTISMSETASASSAKSKMFCDRLITIRIHPDSDSLSSVITADALADI